MRAVGLGGTNSMEGLIRRVLGIQFVQYFLASLAALMVDMGTFVVFLNIGVTPGLAAAIGYSAGIGVHWAIVSRSVFAAGTATRGTARTQQKALFLITALAGLALTTGIVTLADALALNVIVSKGFAVAVSFVANYLARKHLVFRLPRSA